MKTINMYLVDNRCPCCNINLRGHLAADCEHVEKKPEAERPCSHCLCKLSLEEKKTDLGHQVWYKIKKRSHVFTLNNLDVADAIAVARMASDGGVGKCQYVRLFHSKSKDSHEMVTNHKPLVQRAQDIAHGIRHARRK